MNFCPASPHTPLKFQMKTTRQLSYNFVFLFFNILLFQIFKIKKIYKIATRNRIFSLKKFFASRASILRHSVCCKLGVTAIVFQILYCTHTWLLFGRLNRVLKDDGALIFISLRHCATALLAFWTSCNFHSGTFHVYIIGQKKFKKFLFLSLSVLSYLAQNSLF